jgi:orotate phosphoribosyltransferase
MMDLPSKRVRQERGDHARHKAKVYESVDAPLFIESDPRQAAAITQRTGRPVFCYETKEMIRPGRVNQTSRTVERAVSKLRSDPKAFPVIVGKQLYYRGYHRIQELLR